MPSGTLSKLASEWSCTLLEARAIPERLLASSNTLILLLGGRLRDSVDIVIGDVSDVRHDPCGREAEVTSVLHFATLLSAGAQQNPLWLHASCPRTVNVFETAARLQMRRSSGPAAAMSSPALRVRVGVISDDCIYDPGFVYGASKVASEKLAFAYADSTVSISRAPACRSMALASTSSLRARWQLLAANLLYRPVVEQGRSSCRSAPARWASCTSRM